MPTATSESDSEQGGFGRRFQRLKTILRRRGSTQGSALNLPRLEQVGYPSAATKISEITAISSAAHDVLPIEVAEPFRTQRPAIFSRPSRAPDQYARLRAIFARHNMEFDTSTWPARASRQSVLVEKQIRMRVRITCHHCLTNYSGSIGCSNCHHHIPERCTGLAHKHKTRANGREPERVAEDKTQKLTPLLNPGMADGWEEGRNAASLMGDEAEDETQVMRSPPNLVPRMPRRRKEVPLVVPSRMGRPDLVRKEVLQRVHRTCCKCRCSFVRESKSCPQCNHVRCTTCPRSPPKLDKWPNGYPGDVVPAAPERRLRQWKKAKLRVRWTCHECRKLFMEAEDRCANCSHTRCSTCERRPPKRVRPPPAQNTVDWVPEESAAEGSPLKQPDVTGSPVIDTSTPKDQPGRD